MSKTMAQENNKQQFQCSGDCMKCNPLQRQYCAAQMSYDAKQMLNAMQRLLAEMQGTIHELKEKVDAMQGSGANLFNPTTNGEGELFPKEFRKEE